MKLFKHFKTQLIISFVLVGFLPSLLITMNNYFSIKSGIEKEVNSKLLAISSSKAEEVTSYLETIKKQLLTYSKTTHIIDSSQKFVDAYNNIDVNLTSEMKQGVLKYYKDEFNKKYESEIGKPYSIDDLVNPLEDKDWVMQYAFISNNEHPLGAKDKLDISTVLPNYSKVHKVYHPAIREYLSKFEYYDIFIIDKDSGRIVYSVFKELDFSTSLNSGPYKDSNLAKTYREALKITNPDEVAFRDFEKYTPSYEAPASFIATPIWKDGKIVAVLAYQMPVGAINEIMSSTKGLGRGGEAYLLGEDNRLRSDLKNNKNYSIVSSFRKNLTLKSNDKQLAFKSGQSASVSQNVNGEGVYRNVKRVMFEGSKWIVVTEILESVAFASLVNLRNHAFLFSFVIVIFVIFFGFFLSNKLANRISRITESLSKSSHEVQNASQSLSLASDRMNDSVSSQSNSISQTASAVDEISSMLAKSDDSAQSASKLSRLTKKNAQEGAGTVEKMLKEIDLISKSYDEIAKSIESNNNDIGDIVNVITEISQKTTVINDIVFQTKLLSFNASVEAARAGEHGKGFAVVAEEVGNLATMSGSAADEIMSMLEGSINKVNSIASKTQTEVTKIVDEGKCQVDIGVGVAKESRDKLNAIHENIAQLDTSVSEIAAASREQQAGIEDIKSAISKLEESTMVSKEMSSSTDQSSTKLFNQSKELRDSIESLRELLGTKKDT